MHGKGWKSPLRYTLGLNLSKCSCWIDLSLLEKICDTILLLVDKKEKLVLHFMSINCKWKLLFRICWDPGIKNRWFVRQVLRLAVVKCGMGSRRRRRSFQVTSTLLLYSCVVRIHWINSCFLIKFQDNHQYIIKNSSSKWWVEEG